MDSLYIKQSDSTLEVDFNPVTGVLCMRGESYPENALKFFAPVLAWINDYLAGLGAGDSVTVDMDIIYFNSSSSKVLMNIFDSFDSAARRGVVVSILWRHHEENEIAQECGEEFAEELEHARFALLPYEDGQ